MRAHAERRRSAPTIITFKLSVGLALQASHVSGDINRSIGPVDFRMLSHRMSPSLSVMWILALWNSVELGEFTEVVGSVIVVTDGGVYFEAERS
jgi:hypothetical protein